MGGEWGHISSQEVVVRPPEVFVRPLAHDEARRLKRRAKEAKHFSTRQRAAILLASNVGNSAGVPAGSPTPSAVRRSRWPVPAPTAKGLR